MKPLPEGRPTAPVADTTTAAASADQIAEAVHEVMHLYRSVQHRSAAGGAAAHQAITPVEARVLAYFARHPGATQSDLVAHAARDKGQLARLVGALRERGLMDARADETDRRVQRLFLTPAGKAVQAHMHKQRQRVAQLAAAGLHEHESRQLLELLQRLKGNLEGAR